MVAQHATDAGVGDSACVPTEGSPAHHVSVTEVSAEDVEAMKAVIAKLSAELDSLKAQQSQPSSSSALPSVPGNTYLEGNTDPVVSDPDLQAVSLA